jgi:hypothetical protein
MNCINRKTKALFFAAGIPTFIGTGLFEFVRFYDVAATVLVAMLGSILVSFCVFLISIGFTQFHRKIWWVTILHFLLLPVTGIIITGSYYFLAQFAPIGQWTEVITPPEQIDHFLPSADPTIFGFSLFVMSKSGMTYAYDCVTYEGCTWNQREYILNEQDSYQHSKTVLANRLIPIPPGRIVESQHKIGRGPDFETGVMYIRLADGRIYYWTQFWSVYDTLFLLFGFSLTGLVAGIFTSISVLNLRPR